MSSYNILFFSNNCDGSKHLISLMQTEKLLQFFYTVCTDNNPRVPPQITLTPTILIRGVPTPYVAADAFAWLSKMKQWKINMTMQKISGAQQQYMQEINNNLVSDNTNLLSFSQAEMAGMSDIFAYLKDDSALPHTYFDCDSLGKENIFTPPSEDSKNKINSVKQKELHNNLEQERKKQDETIKQTFETFRKNYRQ